MNKQELKGMTVNERLLVLGLLAEWDAVAKAWGGDKLRAVLWQAKFTEQQATQTVDALLANPKHYGF